MPPLKTFLPRLLPDSARLTTMATPTTRSDTCFIIPNYLLQHVADNHNASEHSRACALQSLHHNARLSGLRQNFAMHTQTPTQGIVPGYMHQEISSSSTASEESKQRAANQQLSDQGVRAAREGAPAVSKATTTTRLNRVLYDSEKTSELPGNRLRKEGQTTTLDSEGTNVWNYFGNTFKFYSDKMGRNSIDNRGMSLIGSIHYDDEQPPPGYDNAFWNGQQMVFGDGDPDIFQDFTKSEDVIGHELTHGVTQFTANLPYHLQSGAMNESISDVFGSMVKQYNGGTNPQTSAQADWLIGAGIFYPKVGIAALRSMKAPGTAYKNSVIGSDRQPAHMDHYANLPDTDAGDSGGVHINSGIPNKAFYLACTKIGGYSWDVAGKIWYDTLLDPALKTFAARQSNWDKVFPYFAGLTVKHAAAYGANIPAMITAAWKEVGVTASA